MFMRNAPTLRLFLSLLILCSILSSCRHKEQADYRNYVMFDNGRAGFAKPAGSFPDPGYLEILKVGNSNINLVLNLDTMNKPWQWITVSKFAADSVIPMEIAFVEETVKFPAENMGWKTRLADFGVYDKSGRRYRYKVSIVDYEGARPFLKELVRNGDSLNKSNPERKVQFKIMYYFMKNDLDSIMYELSISTDSAMFSRSSFILKTAAESFRFVE